MSNALAIAAVTSTLRNLLTAGLSADPDLQDIVVTMLPLDRARVNGSTNNQVNIFLYHVVPSSAWRNLDLPGRARPGETSAPALGLNLYYLITAFGRDNDANRPFSHQVMGRAMSTLHDHPLLGADEIKAALANNDLWAQVERVRFTVQPYSMEEIAKLWTGFQTEYRLSVAYEASVVLIESARRITAPLPVLTRGEEDSGITTHPNPLSPFPTLDQVTAPNRQPTAKLGDVLTLIGRNLAADQVVIHFSSARLDSSVKIPAESPATDTKLTVTVPNDPANFPAGLYTVAAVLSSRGEPGRTSNELPLAVAPVITNNNLPLAVRRSGRHQATIRLTCSPEVRPDQRVALLLGSREIPAAPRAARTAELSFVVTDAVPGTFWMRLRVDGVDSQLVDQSATLPAFIETQKVTIR